jgi:CRISPR/Cas system CSM-associated protein Csm3 (group 7 of RAMP superfamily)
MTIQYEIQFLSDWHCGSGLTSNADADISVIKNAQNLPFIPGKTIKGLVRNALLEISQVQPEMISNSTIALLLGKQADNDKKTPSEPGNTFFSNAELSSTEQQQITEELSTFLYRNLASTAISDTGVAQAKSLRTMEVCMPVALQGTIEITNDADEKPITMALQWIRQIGVNRNRGLGRCKISVNTKTNKA